MKVELHTPHEKIQDSIKMILFRNFLGGIAWAVGITIGFSLLITILRFLSSSVDLVPLVGTFVSDILDYVLSYNKNLR